MPRSSGKDVMSAALEIAQLASAAQFAPLPYVKVAASALIQIVQIVESLKGDPALIELVQDATGVIAILSKWAENTSRPNITPEVEESLTELIQTLQAILHFAEKRSSKRSFWSAILNSYHTKELEEYRSRLTLASARFMIASQLKIDGQLSEIAKSVDQVAIRTTMMRKEQVIDKLKARSALDACYNEARGKCAEGTRDRVIQQILDWFNDSKNLHKTFWLYGPAGHGKTTIAQTVAHILKEKENLGASFFFGSGSAIQFVATIAYQLCLTIPGLFDRVVSALELDPALLDSSLSQQMEKLVVVPLRELSSNAGTPGIYHPWLIIVDGIDECDEKLQQEIVQIIQNCVENQWSPFRVLLSSRDSYLIRRALSSPEVLSLSETTVVDDIKAFYISSFAEIKAKHPELKEYSEWPPAEAIENLVQKAGLFTMASTVVRFVENSFRDPNEGLQQILTSLNIGGRPIESLELPYVNILRKVPTHAVNNVRAIMSWLIFGREKIKSMSLCDRLFSFTPGYSAICLAPLMSVINVPDPSRVTVNASAESRSLGFFHASFPDLLKSLSRLKQHNLETFYCDPSRAHPMLARCWLKYYEKYGNDYSALRSSHIKGGRLIEAYRRQSHISDIFERISAHCSEPSCCDGSLFLDEFFIESLQRVNFTICLHDCADEPKIWWFQIAPLLTFVALCLSFPRTPQFDPVMSPSVRGLVEYIRTYWSRFPSSIRDHIPDIMYLTSSSPKRDITGFSQPSVTHSIFFHKSQRASQLTYGILTGQTLEAIRDSLLAPDGMTGPDSKRYAMIASWLMKGWNVESEGHGGKSGYHPYIKTDEIPYLLTLILSKAAVDPSIEEQLKRSVFMQDQSLNRGTTRVGGLQFSYDDFNYFSNVSKSYISRVRS